MKRLSLQQMTILKALSECSGSAPVADVMAKIPDNWPLRDVSRHLRNLSISGLVKRNGSTTRDMVYTIEPAGREAIETVITNLTG